MKIHQKLLHIAATRQKQLHSQCRTQGFVCHIILQIRQQLFIFAVKYNSVSQYHTPLYKRIHPKPFKQLEQRHFGVIGIFKPSRNGLPYLFYLFGLLWTYLVTQTTLCRFGQLIFKFLARHDRSKHIFHLTGRPQPLMMHIIKIQGYIQPHKQITQQFPLGLISLVWLHRLPLHFYLLPFNYGV